MKLLVLAEDFYPNVSGGANTRWRFCQLAERRGHDVTVFTPLREETPRRETVDGVEIRRPFHAKLGRVPAYSTLALVTRTAFTAILFLYLVVWLRGHPFDGVHSASTSMHWVGKILSWLYGLPLVTFIGFTPSAGGDWEWSPAFVRERINFHLFMGDVVLTRTERVKTILEEITDADMGLIDGILHEKKIRSVASDLNAARERSALGVAGDEKLLVYVGRLVPIKNPTTVVEVLADLPDEYQLAIVGDGPSRGAVEKRAAELDVADRVTLLGEQEHVDTLAIIAAADALLLTSDVESYAAVVFEALALGTSVVSTPVANLDAVDHPDLRLVSVDEFVPTLQRLDPDPESEVDEAVLETYSIERYTDRILAAFETLATGAGGT
jgi:glycosyltransferase involved in cell wall biosynthesis